MNKSIVIVAIVMTLIIGLVGGYIIKDAVSSPETIQAEESSTVDTLSTDSVSSQSTVTETSKSLPSGHAAKIKIAFGQYEKNNNSYDPKIVTHENCDYEFITETMIKITTSDGNVFLVPTERIQSIIL